MVLSAIAIVAAGTGCSPKGSSSLTTAKRNNTTAQTPRVQDVDTETAAERNARLRAERDAEAKAKAEAEAARKAAEAEMEAARAQAEEAAKKAKAEAEARAKKAAEEALVVKEEKVKVIESADADSNKRYHIIIGSFKSLENARNLCQEVIKKSFLPSIMENEDGMYRVSIYSCSTEKTARTKIADIRKQYPQYVGTWLLIEKR